MSGFPSELPRETLSWLAGVLDSGERIVSIRSMGVSSTSMHAIDVVGANDRARHLALRRFVDAERLTSDPWYVPQHEADVLVLLEQTRVPAPALIAADTTAESCDAPALLTERVAGGPAGEPNDMESFLRQMAEVLPAIHEVIGREVGALVPYEPYYREGELRAPEWSNRPGVWERVFEVIDGPPPDSPAGFIHRDYHPGNTVWLEGRLTGVVDWTTGCRGPFSIDLAHMRQNLAGDFSPATAERFLAIHRSVIGAAWDHHPYWDLLDAADRLPDFARPTNSEEAGELQRFEDFVVAVLSRL